MWGLGIKLDGEAQEGKVIAKLTSRGFGQVPLCRQKRLLDPFA